MAKFFLSYSSKDAGYAENLRKHIELLDSSNDVYMDKFSIPLGADWQQNLFRNIDTRDFFILILSKNAIETEFVEIEIKRVQKSELSSGIRKLYVIRIDDVEIPKYLMINQILNSSANFAVDFYKLMLGIRLGNSHFEIAESVSNETKHDGYNVKLWVKCDRKLLKLIDLVEFRFDSWFEEATAGVEGTKESKNKKSNFAVSFWTSEASVVFITIYLTNTKQIHFIHKVTING
jgi:hypothetical protein